MALGEYYHKVETDYTRAMEEFAMARSELHNDPELLNSIAYLQMRQGNFEEAVANRRKAVELDPLNASRYRDLANSLDFTQQFDEALVVIDQAIALEPEDARNYSEKIGIMTSAHGDVGLIKGVVDEALVRTDTVEFIRSNWEFKRHLPDVPWDDMQERFIQHVRDSSENDTVYYTSLLWMHVNVGDATWFTDNAGTLKKYGEKRYRDHPENPYANSHYGLVLGLLGECDRAVELGARGKELLSVDDCHY